MSASQTIKRHFLIQIVILILVFSTLIVLVDRLVMERIYQNLSQKIMKQAIHEVESILINHYQTMEQMNRIMLAQTIQNSEDLMPFLGAHLTYVEYEDGTKITLAGTRQNTPPFIQVQSGSNGKIVTSGLSAEAIRKGILDIGILENGVIGIAREGFSTILSEPEKVWAILGGQENLPIFLENWRQHVVDHHENDFIWKRFPDLERPSWTALKRLKLGEGPTFYLHVLVPESDLLQNISYAQFALVALAFMILISAVFMASRLAKKLTEPICLIVEKSKKIRAGDLSPGSRVASGLQEIELLAQSQEMMRKSLQTLLKMEGDLAIARQIQQNTFPKSIPDVKGYDLAAWNQPADETGGDTYDLVAVEKDGRQTAVLILADATGHGIGPALSVTQLRAMLRMGLRMNKELEPILPELNRQLYLDLPASKFISAWIAVIEENSNRLHYYCAGQGPIYVFRAATGSLEKLGVSSYPFGIRKVLPDHRLKETSMHSGDILFALTDGFYEAQNPGGDFFGEDKIVEVVANNNGLSALDLLDVIIAETKRFTDGAAILDDQTAIIIKRN